MWNCFAICCIAVIACCRVSVLRIMCMVRFLNMMAPLMVLGIHPLVDGVVGCCLVSLLISSSSSMCRMTG